MRLNDVTGLEVFTQELRLASDTDSRFQWLLGGFYSDIKRDYSQRLVNSGADATFLQIWDPFRCPANSQPLGCTLNLGPLANRPFVSEIPYDFKQVAAFAEASLDITERLSATVGGRYYHFDEDCVLFFGGVFADNDGLPDEPTNGPGSTNDDGFLPRVLLSYAVSDSVQFNAQVAEGFRLGGINDPLNPSLCSPDDLATYCGRPTFDGETLWNYELGAKISFADDRGQLNIAAFYADIEDLQVPALAGTCSSRIAFNTPEAHSTGVELELTAAPTDRFDFGISATYTQSEVDTTVTDINGNVLAGIERGNRLPSVPEFQLSANATYSWPFTASLDGFVTGVYQHVGSRYTQMGD